jgi:hypothetical protein
LAFENPNITAVAVEATEFPDLARRFRVSAVPKTVVNASGEILGALPPDAFIQQVIEQVSSLKSQVSDDSRPQT